jgi:hypothetical protein
MSTTKRTGRPSVYTAELFEQICEGLAEGKSLRQVCKAPGMPSEVSVRTWVLDNREGCAEAYQRARNIGLDMMADEIIRISETPENGKTTKRDGDGKVIEVTEGDMLQHRKLRIYALQWYLAKLGRKKYGDKLDLGSDPEAPLSVTINRLTDGKFQKE